MILRRPNISQRQSGFSLLEIMIVVVIVGIMVSLVSLSFSTVADDSLDEQARRFEALIDLAIDEAGMQGREYGLRFYQHSYEFAVRAPAVDEEGQQIWLWTPLEADQLLKPRDLGEELVLELEIDGDEISLDFERDTEEAYVPQVFLFSSGDIEPPFSLRIRPEFSGNAIRIDVDTLGNIEAERDDF